MKLKPRQQQLVGVKLVVLLSRITELRLGIEHVGSLSSPLFLAHWLIRDDVLAQHVLHLLAVAHGSSLLSAGEADAACNTKAAFDSRIARSRGCHSCRGATGSKVKHGNAANATRLPARQEEEIVRLTCARHGNSRLQHRKCFAPSASLTFN
jgi:hypothetical protein